jgi:hypothetical protein
MTATQPEMFDGPELTAEERAANEEFLAVMAELRELEPDADDYVGLRPGHHLTRCGGDDGRHGCGQLLLAANLPGEPPRGFRVTDNDALPPLRYGWRAVRGRRVAVCCGCAVAERRANRGRTGA